MSGFTRIDLRAIIVVTSYKPTAPKRARCNKRWSNAALVILMRTS